MCIIRISSCYAASSVLFTSLDKFEVEKSDRWFFRKIVRRLDSTRNQTYFPVPVGSPEVAERDGANGKTWELASHNCTPSLH